MRAVVFWEEGFPFQDTAPLSRKAVEASFRKDDSVEFVECNGLAAALDGKDPGQANFDIDLVCKDLATMLAEAKIRGATLPLAEKALAIYADALTAGWGKRDGAWLPAYWPNSGSR